MTPSPRFDEQSTADDSASVPNGTSPAGFVMRVHGGQHDGRLIHVSADKCTIGRSPDCTIRLASPEFEPLHCLIVRGRGGVVARCWSAETTKLNGKEFSVSWMVPGDRLGVGPIELELLEAIGNAESTHKPLESSAPTHPASDDCPREEAASARTGDRSTPVQLAEDREEQLERFRSMELELKQTLAERNRLRAVVDELKDEVTSVMRLREEWQQERAELERQLQAALQAVGRSTNASRSYSEALDEPSTQSAPIPNTGAYMPPDEADDAPLDDDLSVDMKAVLARYGVVLKDDEDRSSNNHWGASASVTGAVTPSAQNRRTEVSSTHDSPDREEATKATDPAVVARRRSPVPRINLSALRDVANQSARVAIDRAAHRRGLREAAFKWSISLGAVAIGWFVTQILRHDATLARVLSAACWTIAVWWLFLGSLVYRRAVLTNPKRRQRLAQAANS